MDQPIKVIDYGYVMPGQKLKTTAEDRERMKKLFDELKKVAKEHDVVFVCVKGDER